MNHRGRFQAQGHRLEESESWAKPDPLYIDEGKTLLTNLEQKIPAFESRKRKAAFCPVKRLSNSPAKTEE